MAKKSPILEARARLAEATKARDYLQSVVERPGYEEYIAGPRRKELEEAAEALRQVDLGDSLQTAEAVRRWRRAEQQLDSLREDLAQAEKRVTAATRLVENAQKPESGRRAMP